MSLLQTLVMKKYQPVSGKTYYLYRNYSGTLFVLDDRVATAEMLNSYVWSL